MQECKDAEPEVLFIGDSMIQLMQQHEVQQVVSAAFEWNCVNLSINLMMMMMMMMISALSGLEGSVLSAARAQLRSGRRHDLQRSLEDPERRAAQHPAEGTASSEHRK